MEGRERREERRKEGRKEGKKEGRKVTGEHPRAIFPY